MDLTQIRAIEHKITSVRDRLQTAHPSQPLYLPFQFRGDGLRLMFNYFAKLPLAIVELLFDKTGLAEAQADPPKEEDGPEEPNPRGKPGGFLNPFKRGKDTDYLLEIEGGVRRRGRHHETLVNDFAAYLAAKGLSIGHNAAVDLGILQPSTIIEAKMVQSWPRSIREAIGQLYEYRFFQVARPDSHLVFLASKPVPKKWIKYLEDDRGNGVAWREEAGFALLKLVQRWIPKAL